MTNFEEHLNRILHRASCPSTTELGEYQLNLLSNQRTAEISEHLSECPHCTRELKQLNHFMDEVGPDLDYSLIENVKIWIAERKPRKPSMPDFSTTGQLTPAFSLRGEGTEAMVYSAGDAELTLEVAPASQGSNLRSILGLVTGIEPSGVDVILLQAGKPLLSMELDELGNFIVPELGSGEYTLILAGKEFEIHVQELKI